VVFKALVCLVKHLQGEVNADYLTLGADGRPQQTKIQASAAAYLDNPVPRLQVESSDGLFSIRELSKTERIIKIGSEIVPFGSLSIKVDEFLFIKGHLGLQRHQFSSGLALPFPQQPWLLPRKR
jgi:hypothetical protein